MVSHFFEIVKISVLSWIYTKTVALRARISVKFYFLGPAVYSFWQKSSRRGVYFSPKTVRRKHEKTEGFIHPSPVVSAPRYLRCSFSCVTAFWRKVSWIVRRKCLRIARLSMTKSHTKQNRRSAPEICQYISAKDCVKKRCGCLGFAGLVQRVQFLAVFLHPTKRRYGSVFTIKLLAIPVSPWVSDAKNKKTTTLRCDNFWLF